MSHRQLFILYTAAAAGYGALAAVEALRVIEAGRRPALIIEQTHVHVPPSPKE